MSSGEGGGGSPFDDLTAADALPAVVPEPERLPARGVSAVPGAGRAPVAEDPSLLSANLNVGVRLFASAVTFVFVSFLFAFFYLDAVNSNGLFKPPGTNPSAAYGIVMLVCVLGSTAAFMFARRSLSAEAAGGWLVGLSASLGLGLVVVVLQILQYTNYGFSPESGGYASVFVGWTVAYLVFWVGALYWVETFLAQSLRRPPAEAESEITRPLEVLGPSASACLVYLLTMAGVELVTWILLYLVK
ncbi:MAG: cytochrome c oxidase subunit 3 [Actinomycetota bacterium]|nr:cytochrome c oxidase subunit 3 [Actinomycetota bacterium]